MATGDVDGSGTGDVVILPGGSGRLTVYVRWDPWLFGASWVYFADVEGGPYDGMQVGNFDGVRGADVFLWGRGDRPDRLLLSRPSGFIDGPPVEVGGSDRAKLVRGDFNSDGRVDLLVYEPGATGDAFHPGGAVPFSTSVPADFGATFQRVTVLDFDGDGRQDLFFYGVGERPDRLKLGQGSFEFRPGPRVSLGFDFRSIAAGDVNGDGRDDLVLVRRTPGGGHPDGFVAYADGLRFRHRGITPPEDGIPAPFNFDNRGGRDIFWFTPNLEEHPIWTGRRI